MDSPLSEQERNYLRSLRENPIWDGILQKLKDYHHTPRYKPGGDEKQIYNWMYRSGGKDAIEGLLGLLTGQEIKPEE